MAGLKAREKQMENCTNAVVEPRDAVSGEYALMRSMFTLNLNQQKKY
jgi:hypothetical protein